MDRVSTEQMTTAGLLAIYLAITKKPEIAPVFHSGLTHDHRFTSVTLYQRNYEVTEISGWSNVS